MADTEDDVPEGGKFEPETYARAREQVNKSQTFGQAFKAARSAGNKTFEWQGKKYTTEMASDKKPGGALAAEGRSVRKPKEYSEPTTVSSVDKEPGLEESGPLEALLGPVKVGAGAAAAGLAGLKALKAARAARATKAATDFSARRAAPRNLAEETMAGEGGPNFRRGGKIASKVKPKAYAKGGSVSSASKRADGIASKGKTKGRVC